MEEEVVATRTSSAVAEDQDLGEAFVGALFPEATSEEVEDFFFLVVLILFDHIYASTAKK